MSFPVVPLPSWPAGGLPPEELKAQIRIWVDAPALAALVEAFDGEPPSGGLADRLAYLEKFSAVWDSRGGGERFDTRYAQHTAEVGDLIKEAAQSLGLIGRGHPHRDQYDHVLVLGGGRVTGRARSLYAAQLLVNGVSAGSVVGLGSLRMLPPAATVADPGSAADVTEGEAMLRGLQEAFPPTGGTGERRGTTADGNDWWVRSYPSGSRTMHTIAAPSRRPGQRANTIDTLHGWVNLIAPPTAVESVLLVTTDLYVPFQHFDAITTLGLEMRCGIETVGFATGSFKQWPNGPARPGELLQETRSAILSLHRLFQRVA